MRSKKSKNEKISIVSLDSITQLQKIALEGEIAQALSTARHDSEILYRYYTILKRAPKEISYLLVQIIRDMTDIKQELLDRVTLEASLDIIPLWIWVNRTTADLKLSLKLACADQIGNASMNRKELQKKLIRSAFVYYVRSISMVSPTAAETLCNHIINEETTDLSFLESACFSLIPEIKELDKDAIVAEEVIHTTFDINKILSYKIETEVLKDFNKKETRKLKSSKSTDTSINTNTEEPVDLSEMLKKTINEILEAQQSNLTKSTGKFIVVKEYDGCDISTPLKECSSEEEAEKFIENMKKQFPELLKTVTFRICKG